MGVLRPLCTRGRGSLRVSCGELVFRYCSLAARTHEQSVMEYANQPMAHPSGVALVAPSHPPPPAVSGIGQDAPVWDAPAMSLSSSRQPLLGAGRGWWARRITRRPKGGLPGESYQVRQLLAGECDPAAWDALLHGPPPTICWSYGQESPGAIGVGARWTQTAWKDGRFRGGGLANERGETRGQRLVDCRVGGWFPPYGGESRRFIGHEGDLQACWGTVAYRAPLHESISVPMD